MSKPTLEDIRAKHADDCSCAVIDWRTPHCRTHAVEASPHWDVHQLLAWILDLETVLAWYADLDNYLGHCPAMLGDLGNRARTTLDGES